MFTIKITEIPVLSAPGVSPQPYTRIFKAKNFKETENKTSFKITELKSEDSQNLIPDCLEYLTEDQNPEINEFYNYRLNASSTRYDCNYKKNFKCEVYRDNVLDYTLTLKCGNGQVFIKS